MGITLLPSMRVFTFARGFVCFMPYYTGVLLVERLTCVVACLVQCDIILCPGKGAGGNSGWLRDSMLQVRRKKGSIFPVRYFIVYISEILSLFSSFLSEYKTIQTV